MITHKSLNFNININEYLNYIANLEVDTLKCSNCLNSNLERHGYYSRYIIVNGDKIRIRILRIRCKCCGKTHAVLPSFVVPYLHIPMKELQAILVSIDKNENQNLEPHFIKTCKRIYRFWIQKLLSIGCWFKDELKSLIVKSSSKFRLCFMQIHRGNFFYF